MLVLSTLYLVPELIFNAQLVNVTGGLNSDFEQMRKVELFGRAISGIGVSLLLISLLSARHFTHSLRFFILATLITLLAWPASFFGQKWAVDTFIIERSSAQERQKATMAIMLKDALANNAINIEGINFNSDAESSPANKTFLTLFGGLLYADPSIQETLNSHMSDIIRKFVSVRANNQFDAHYANYTRLYEEVAARYDEYLAGSKRYNDAINNIHQAQSNSLVELNSTLQDAYVEYQRSVSRFQSTTRDKAEEFGPQIYDFFKRLEKCNEKKNNKRCNEQLMARYRQEILKVGVGYIDPNYFLMVEDVSFWENLTNTVVGGVLSGGMLTVLQGLSFATGGEGGWKDKKYYWTNDIDFYQSKFSDKMAPKFEEQSGYPTDIETFDEFKKHNSTRLKVRAHFSKSGIELPKSWVITDSTTLANAVDSIVRKDAASAWDRHMQQMDLTLPPNQDWLAFQKNSDVQRILSDRLGDYYVDGMRVDLNERQFQSTIVKPIIDRQTTRLHEEYQASERLFENGAELEQRGKDALRAVVVPPLSMAISLVLICLTLVTLPAKYYALFSSEASRKGALLSGAIAFIVLLVPVFVPNPLSTSNSNPTITYFFEKMDENVSPVLGGVLNWTLDAQPLMLLLGNKINDTSNLYERFDPIQSVLEGWDSKFLTAIPAWKPDKDQTVDVISVQGASPVPLQIEVNAESATIKVMNIKPRFEQKMMLVPGRYDIQVSAPGYVTQRRWARLDKSGNPIVFMLVKM